MEASKFLQVVKEQGRLARNVEVTKLDQVSLNCSHLAKLYFSMAAVLH